jgi:GT2 family glycosyltransferase
MIKALRTIPVSLEVIVLTHNRFADSKHCIESLYQYTEDFGLVILDNASTDGTPSYLMEIARQKDNISLYLADQNLGVIDGRIRGYEISSILRHKAKLICFLDDDQFVSRGWMESYHRYLKFCDIVGFEGWKMRDDFYPYARAVANDTYNYVGCGGMVLRKEVIDQIGLFDRRFNPMFFEDPDFCFRAYDAGFRLCWNPVSRIIHHPHRLLGEKNERQEQFRKSWKLFKDKWAGKKMPRLPNHEKTDPTH